MESIYIAFNQDQLIDHRHDKATIPDSLSCQYPWNVYKLPRSFEQDAFAYLWGSQPIAVNTKDIKKVIPEPEFHGASYRVYLKNPFLVVSIGEGTPLVLDGCYSNYARYFATRYCKFDDGAAYVEFVAYAPTQWTFGPGHSKWPPFILVISTGSVHMELDRTTQQWLSHQQCIPLTVDSPHLIASSSTSVQMNQSSTLQASPASYTGCSPYTTQNHTAIAKTTAEVISPDISRSSPTNMQIAVPPLARLQYPPPLVPFQASSFLHTRADTPLIPAVEAEAYGIRNKLSLLYRKFVSIMTLQD